MNFEFIFNKTFRDITLMKHKAIQAIDQAYIEGDIEAARNASKELEVLSRVIQLILNNAEIKVKDWEGML